MATKKVAKKAAKKAAPAEKKLHKKSVEGMKANLAHVLVRPWVTEKAAYASDKGMYTFQVDPKASKGQIKDAFHAMYGVQPVKVTTTTVKPAQRLVRGRIGIQRGHKKAVVFVPAGTSIDFL